MSTESGLWKKLKKALPQADLCRHEDKFRKGIPDVSYGLQRCNGWIELKVAKYPPSPASPIRFPNLKVEQVKWMERRGRAGGRVFVLVWIEQDFFLIPWFNVWRLGTLNASGLHAAACYWSQFSLEPLGLSDALVARVSRSRLKNRSRTTL